MKYLNQNGQKYWRLEKKQDNMKNNLIIIILLILLGLFVWNIYLSNNLKTDVKGYKKNIEKIQIKIDSAKIENVKLNHKLDTLRTQINLVNNEIIKLDNNITIIRKQTNDKVNSVDNMSDLELKRFFTNRYNQYNITQ